MEYELIKLIRGYILTEVNNTSKVNINLAKSDLKDIRKALDVKVVATTESIDDKDYKKLRIEDCDRLFGIKETRQPQVSKKYTNANYSSLVFSTYINELKGIHEIVRLQMYNYLSGRITHKAFLQFYHQYEATLHEHGIIKVNNWELDENLDDEYFNDNLDAIELNRELDKDDKTKIPVTVVSLSDENGYVIMFKK